jgi:hypothetical protein
MNYTLQIFSRRQRSIVDTVEYALTLPREWRRLASIWLFFAAVGLLITYVVVVNTGMARSAGLREAERELRALEEVKADLVARASQASAPAELEARAASAGLVEVEAVRYLTTDTSVALIR